MQQSIPQRLAADLKLKNEQVTAVLDLLTEGATLPFIARYRKERTGGLDELAIAAIRDGGRALEELEKRRASIITSLSERDLYLGELRTGIDAAQNLKQLEDLYLPHRIRRRTRATVARELGLEPLARKLLHEGVRTDVAAAFVDPAKGVQTAEEALAGARDIIAEWVSEDPPLRAQMRHLFATKAALSSKVDPKKIEAGQKFSDYFDWTEKAASVPSHRLLAILRGESEGVLKVSLRPDPQEALALLRRHFVACQKSPEQILLAMEDGYKRLLAPAMETELRSHLKQNADSEAIKVFRDNVRELLMAAPLGQKAILAIDPGFRTGCKVVCLDPQGKLMHHAVIYPTSSPKAVAESQRMIADLVRRYAIEAIAIGNGTASRETERFIRDCDLKPQPLIVQVSESGASIYSASDIARQEFPDLDLTVRGAVSIGRRLADPLAELVKLDPKSIGVGQYQHDVDQVALQQALDETVISCVNRVGVELNTASASLLSYVSGLGPQLAQNVVAYRNENGPFVSKAELKKVKRLGPKAFEQAAGFLRIHDALNPLDRSAVHPERYDLVRKMCADNHTSVEELMRCEEKRLAVDLKPYCKGEIGLPTLTDIMAELARPGRDPRQQFEAFSFAEGVEKISDLQVGMRLPGRVTNVTNFGAFIDIGVHQDGLAHISQLADRFVKDPALVVKVGQQVLAWVIEVDEKRKRIGLSLRPECPVNPGR
ncbi:MAG: RNA-binding transcriptional accessory protein [Desulfuromonadaceae bacterium]|nr:RNA-binding transcriptional accessory protein [Desulfuromonadaceae bacterium]